MKNFTKLLLGSLVLFSLSGCTAGDMITSYTSISDQSETTLQNTSETPKQRVYMDEIKGTLKDFTGATLTMESQEQTYVFDLSEATLECEDGMITGDEISVIYEGQLSNKDTSTVKALKVVDDFHKKHQLEVRKAYGEVQSLTPNTITIKNKKGKTATYPITGTEQYYQNGIRTGVWVYIHFKGKFASSQDTQSSSLNASHLKVLSISDIDPLTLPDPTPTPDPAQVSADDSAKEQQIHAEIQNISPTCIVNEDSVPSLIGYGLIDHCVPLSQKYYLMEAYDRDNVMYDYIEFPKSNHGMYNDLDKLQEFLDKSLEYAKVYFTD